MLFVSFLCKAKLNAQELIALLTLFFAKKGKQFFFLNTTEKNVSYPFIPFFAKKRECIPPFAKKDAKNKFSLKRDIFFLFKYYKYPFLAKISENLSFYKKNKGIRKRVFYPFFSEKRKTPFIVLFFFAKKGIRRVRIPPSAKNT